MKSSIFSAIALSLTVSSAVQAEEISYERAIEWYQMAVDQNHAGAQNNLGNLYFKGLGTDKDYEKSFGLFQKSFEQDKENHKAAAFNLGLSYEFGYGTEVSIAKAVELYNIADTTPAHSRLAQIFFYGKEGEYQDYYKSYEYLIRLPEEHSDITRYMLGKSYLEGLGIEQDTSKALDILIKTAENGHMNSKLLLANSYYNGTPFTQNDREALRWFMSAGKQGNANAQFMAGLILSKLSG